MSTWADKLKEKKTAPPQDQKGEANDEPKVISPDEEKPIVDISAGAIVAGNPPSANSKDASQERQCEAPTTSYVNLGPVSLPADLANLVSDTFTFGEAPATQLSSAIPTAPPPVPAPAHVQSGPSKPADTADASTTRSAPARNAAPLQRAQRQSQRGRYQNHNPSNAYGAYRPISDKNPYYINNGFGDAFFKYNMRQQQQCQSHNSNVNTMGGMESSQIPPLYPTSAGAPVYPPFLDGNAVAYRPSYILNSGLYYSGQLQPWPPYYPSAVSQ